MRIIFAGTTAFSERALSALLDAGHDVALVLTQPDRPAGRGLRPGESAVKRLAREHGTAVMLITHDMGVIAETADRVAVMYAGRLAELGPVREVIHQPRHPYTSGLMGSIPKLGRGAGKRHARLVQIEGAMPRLNAIPAGCAFHPRCGKCFARCRLERPEPIPVGPSHSACWLHAGHPAQA